jgi:hypothetical protein
MTFAPEPELLPALPASLEGILRPYQIAPARHLFALAKRGINSVQLSGCGSGKTAVACAVAFALNAPTLVVAPKVALTPWLRFCELFGEKLSVIGYEALRTGKTPYGWWANPLPADGKLPRYFKCLSCQREIDFDPKKYLSCYCHPQGIHCVEIKKRAHRYGQWTWASQIKFLIFDECHRASAMDSLTADQLFAAHRQHVLWHGMSATLASDPLKLRALGLLLGLHNGTDYFSWAYRLGCRKDPLFHGWKFLVGEEKRLEVMNGIREKLIPARGVRISCEDIPGFPECETTAELFDLDEVPGTVDRLYAEMADAMAVLEARKREDKAPDMPITKLLRAHQKVELLKVPVVVEMVKDRLEEGMSIAVFVNYSATLDELRKRLKTECVIDGRPEHLRRRQDNIDDFQANRQKVVLVKSQAGGVAISLHDLHGGHPRIGYVFPGFSSTIFKQLLGRLHRDGAKTKAQYRVVLAAGSVEEQIHRSLKGKLNGLAALNDGDMCPDSLKLTVGPLAGLLP